MAAQQPLPSSTLPAGLELFFDHEKINVKTQTQAFVLAVHWAIMRGGLRLKRTANASTAADTTEKLPEGWTTNLDHISTAPLILDYVNPANMSQTYQLKVIEVAPNDTVVITVYAPLAPASSSANPRTSSASTFQLASYIQMPETTDIATQSASSIYCNAMAMETKIWSELLEPLGLRVMGQPPVLGPYEDKTKKEEKPRQDPGIRDWDHPTPIGGRPSPLAPGGIGGAGPLPFIPPIGGGGLGRSDLDPLGGVGTGMIADPRGFRNPRLPIGGGHPGVPPGARFDPFGPPRPPIPARPPGPGGPNWGVPNPDEPPPPGFEDMFM